MDEGTATVAAGDIARLAGVGKAAVSNWRRRFPDFPQPVGGSPTSPLYSLGEVEEWLIRHDRAADVSPAERLWPLMRGAVDDVRLVDLTASIGAFLVLHRRKPSAWPKLATLPADALLRAIADGIGELPATLAERWLAPSTDLLRSVVDVADSAGHAETFNALYQRFRDLHARRFVFTTAELAEVMVAMSDVDGGVLLDPSCGTGTVLVAAHAHGASALCGQEPDGGAALLATVRLLLRDAPAAVVVDDALRADAHPDLRADAVVCNPPFNDRSWGYEDLVGDPRWEHGLPPRGESELAWVQHCLARVRPGGHVVIAMPAAAAGRRSGRRIRGNLLRSGALRAVLSVAAAGATSPPNPDVWVLRRPDGSPDATAHVLLADHPDGLPGARQAWRTFADSPGAPLGPGSRAVRVIDLLDDEVDLTPARWLSDRPDTADTAARFGPAAARLRSAVRVLSEAVPDLDLITGVAGRPMTTTGELSRAGLLAIHQAPLKMVTDFGALAVLTVKDVRLSRAPSGRTDPGPGAVLLAEGDVVAPIIARDCVPRVVTEAGAALGPQLLLFRGDPERMDPHFLAGYLRLAGDSGVMSSLAGSLRLDARRAPVPRLPIAEQRRIGAAFGRLGRFEDALREVSALGESVLRLGRTGLGAGALRTPGN